MISEQLKSRDRVSACCIGCKKFFQVLVYKLRTKEKRNQPYRCRNCTHRGDGVGEETPLLKDKVEAECFLCGQTFKVLYGSLKSLKAQNRKYRCHKCSRQRSKNKNLPTPPSRSYHDIVCSCGRTQKVRSDSLKNCTKKYQCKSCAALGYSPETPIPRGGEKVIQKCKGCGVENLIAYRRVRRLAHFKEVYRCWDCIPKFTSKGEISLGYFLTQLNIPIQKNVRKIIANKELDIYLPSENLAIEYNGNYWHSEAKRSNKKYHFEKRIAAEKVGIRLIQIRDDEWLNKEVIVKSIIKHTLGLNKDSFQARKLKVGDVNNSEAQIFLDKNHLMGTYVSSRRLGLYTQDGILVQLLTYRLFTDQSEMEIARACTLIDSSVKGGFSKLLTHILRRHASVKKVISFVDLRYANGHSLTKLGFKKINVTLGFAWTDGTSVFNRRVCRANMKNQNLTEMEWAQNLGLKKLWDAGQAKFVLVF